MHIITSRISNVLLNCGNRIGTLEENNYIWLVEENIAYVPEQVRTHLVESVSDEIKSNPSKYCYTEERGFYANPNYVESDPTNTYGIPDEIYHAIIDDYTAELFGGENDE